MKVPFTEMSDETCGTCRKVKIKKNVAMRMTRRPLDCYKCSRGKRKRGTGRRSA